MDWLYDITANKWVNDVKGHEIKFLWNRRENLTTNKGSIKSTS